MKEKAKIISKRIKRGLFRSKYMLGMSFYNIERSDESNTKEMEVCFEAYSDLKVGDDVLCPIKINHLGISFDFEKPLEKI